MPRKGGKLTPNERAIARIYAQTGDSAYANKQAGYSPHSSSASKALQRPAVQAEVLRIQRELLVNDLLPLATSRLHKILADDTVKPSDHVQAVKVVYSHTLASTEAGSDVPPHEMTPDQLAKALEDARLRAAALESIKADRSREIIDNEPPEGDIFG